MFLIQNIFHLRLHIFMDTASNKMFFLIKPFVKPMFDCLVIIERLMRKLLACWRKQMVVLGSEDGKGITFQRRATS